MEVIGIHKGSYWNRNKGNFNIATKFGFVNDIINVLHYKSYIHNIKKARESLRELSDEEEKELKNHGLKKIKKLPNMYKCPYLSSSLVMLFFRTNHGWYFSSIFKEEISSNLDVVRSYNWIFINPFKKCKEIINEFDKEISEITLSEFEEKIEHRHELIIS